MSFSSQIALGTASLYILLFIKIQEPGILLVNIWHLFNCSRQVCSALHINHHITPCVLLVRWMEMINAI